ncbi:hypothetical protein [Bombella mellum]|uniref:Lipoprotein n=1 Tax=Bombella mellum TaxID=2039288 RepID=A0ABR5ZTM1_9PROT|nr:hypothetical protein [Bombella mellum]MBA5727657.1 hypothetical protein [Bombella mellum]
MSSYFRLPLSDRPVRRVLWACLMGCVLLAGCAGEDDDEAPRHLPKADMTEAYPKKPFRELHHPMPPYSGGMVPMVQAIQPTPDEISGRTVHTADGGSGGGAGGSGGGLPHFPAQTHTEASYGPPPARETR